MKYINGNGELVAEGAKWDGTPESLASIQDIYPHLAETPRGSLEYRGMTVGRGVYVLRLLNMPDRLPVVKTARTVEQEWGFKPVSGERVLAIEELKKTTLLEAQAKQDAGYPGDWRRERWSGLMNALREEVAELHQELFYVDHRPVGEKPRGVDIAAAKKEVAHAALVLAFIHDKLNALELEKMRGKVEKEE